MTSTEAAAGYFGKLPDKADFVTGSCPYGFLKLWEPFLQKGLARSRQDLAEAWEDYYMTMPVWRFWLVPASGDGPLLTAVAGAFMPSVDRVGRKFPLTIVSPVSDDAGETEPLAESWFSALEKALLNALTDEASLSRFQQEVRHIARAEGRGFERTMDSDVKMLAPIAAGPETDAQFWCRAGSREFRFHSRGLPAPEEFRWFLQPDLFAGENGAETDTEQESGHFPGEDHRT